MNKLIFMILLSLTACQPIADYDTDTDDDIADAGIFFWDVMKSSEKIGVIWFTCNLNGKTINNKELNGIFTRSKNMKMGDNLTFIKSASGYISTERELRQNQEVLVNNEEIIPQESTNKDNIIMEKKEELNGLIINVKEL